MCCCCPWIRGLRRKYVLFSKAAVFISALFFGEAFVQNAIIAFLVLLPIWKSESLRKAIVLVNVFQGVNMFLFVILDFIATEHIGEFMVLIGTIPNLIVGLLLLWLSESVLNEDIRIRLIHPGLLFLAIGLAGLSAAAKPFLDYQFTQESNRDPEETDDEFSQKKKLEENEKITETRANVWRYPYVALGSVIASTFTAGLSWKTALMVSSIVMGVAYLIFCSGKCYYSRIEPKRKALVSQLKEARPLLRLLPLWTAFLVYGLVDAAGQTLFIEQSDKLDDSIDIRVPVYSFKVDRIPLSSFYLLRTFTSFIVSRMSSFLIEKWFTATASIRQIASFVRIGIGMLFACACCMMAWWVEVRRLKLIDKYDDHRTVPMKILWLAPQFFLLGIVQGLVEEGQRPLFLDHVPLHMRHFEFPFNVSVLGIGSFLAAFSVLAARRWIGDGENESHLDKYLLMLAIVNFSTLPVYIFLYYKYDWNIETVVQESHAVREGVELSVINPASISTLDREFHEQHPGTDQMSSEHHQITMYECPQNN